MVAESPTFDNVLRIRVRNNCTRQIDFVIEPYGEVFPMEAGAIFEVVAEGSSADAIDVVVDDASIAVWIGSGALLTALYRDSINLLTNTEQLPRVPTYPKLPR